MAKPLRHDEFITPELHDITPAIDPTAVTLGKSFVVCIIGASYGIGEHIAYAYAKAGASGIVVSSRNTAELARVAANINEIDASIRVELVPCDITSADSVKALAESVSSLFGRLDILVSNPAYAGPVTLKVTEGDPAWFQQNFDVNIIGTYHAAHYLIPMLLASENGAKGFLSIGSQAANITKGPIANTGYCLSKFAQSRFMEHVGQQFGGEGLLAVNIHPGAVLTPMAAGNTPEEFMPYMIDDIGLCGAFCVWVSKQTKELDWLTGRFVSANWDVKELLAKKDLIVERDLLKWRISLD